MIALCCFIGNRVDVNSNSRDISFGRGRRTRNINIPITDDNIVEPVENFRLSIRIPQRFNRLINFGLFPTATGNIIDDDGMLLVSQ